MTRWFGDHFKRNSAIGFLSRVVNGSVANIAWLAFEKAATLLNALFVGAYVARHLGPGGVGYIAFATSILAIITPITFFGAETILLRDLVVDPKRTSEAFWSFFWISTGISVLGLFLMAVYSATGSQLGLNEVEKAAVFVTALSLIAQPLNGAKVLFRAKVDSRWVVWATTASIVVFAGIRIACVQSGCGVITFAAVNSGYLVFSAIAIAGIARHLGYIPTFSMPTKKCIGKLAQESWPLCISAVSVALYMNVDVLMLKSLAGASEAGVYSIAVRLSAIWYFVPVAISQTLLPKLVRSHSEGMDDYKKTLHQFFAINAGATVFCIVSAIVLIPPLIDSLFGKQFIESVSVFQIHIFGLVFVFLGTARAQHLSIAKFHRFAMIATLTGLVVNVVLNALLIPRFQESGAAMATVGSYACSAYLSSFAHPELRWVAVAQFTSVLWPFTSRAVKQV